MRRRATRALLELSATASSARAGARDGRGAARAAVGAHFATTTTTTTRPRAARRPIEVERATIDQDKAQIRQSARVRRALKRVVHEELAHKFDGTGANVMDARVSKDFKTVHVLYGTTRMGEEHIAGNALERNAQKIRTMLSKMLTMKHTPRLVFRFEGARSEAQRQFEEALVRSSREFADELREDEEEDESTWDDDDDDDDGRRRRQFIFELVLEQ